MSDKDAHTKLYATREEAIKAGISNPQLVYTPTLGYRWRKWSLKKVLP